MSAIVMMRLLLTLAALLSIVGAPRFASAHTRSESHSIWFVDGGSVHLAFSVSDLEAQRLTKDGRPPDDAQLIAYLKPRVGATSRAGECMLEVAPKAVAAAPGYRRIEFLYGCKSSEDIKLHVDTFFEMAATHVNVAQIQTGKGAFIEDVLNADAHEVDMTEAEGGRLQGAGFLTFVRMGIMHIFTGVDHMSFLLGLVLISKRFRDLAWVISGFTLGHSLTLALSVTGVIRPHGGYIDALVALTIALIGIENIAVQSRQIGKLALWTASVLFAMAGLKVSGMGLLPVTLLVGAGLFASNYLMVAGHIQNAAKLRLVVTLVFGLIHGFGFAADLLSEAIPPSKLAELLIGFNLGVEIGQLTVVSVLSGAVVLLRGARLTLPRPIVVDVSASGLVLIGTYWFVSRSISFT